MPVGLPRFQFPWGAVLALSWVVGAKPLISGSESIAYIAIYNYKILISGYPCRGIDSMIMGH
jgi:hypothetical protein